MNKMTQPTVYIRGNTLWVRFRFDGELIRRSLNLENTKANKKLAQTQIIPQMILKVYTGEFFENDNVKIPTVDEYIKTSFALHSGNRAESTQYAYEKNYARYVKPIFGNKTLDSINANDITLWQNSLQQNEHLAKASIMKIRTMFHTMFEDAIDSDIIDKNPMKRAKRLKETERPKLNRVKLTPFNFDEISLILQAANGQARNILATLFFTGVRAGELIGLKWDCVSFSKKAISIRRQITKGIEKDILKTAQSRRTIPMIDILVPYLKDQYKKTGDLNGYVFLTERTNKPYYHSNKLSEQIWRKAVKKAGVKYRNMHQTRGTFISTLISAGEDINFVSKIAGHQNVNITLESYSEYIPSVNKDFGSCFKELSS